MLGFFFLKQKRIHCCLKKSTPEQSAYYITCSQSSHTIPLSYAPHTPEQSCTPRCTKALAPCVSWRCKLYRLLWLCLCKKKITKKNPHVVRSRSKLLTLLSKWRQTLVSWVKVVGVTCRSTPTSKASWDFVAL